MKAIHSEPLSKTPLRPFADLITTAIQLEATGDFKQAAALYLQCLRLRPASEFCYNRLMILYRKQKLYSKEAAIIKRGIKAFDTLLQGKMRRSTKVAAISRMLLKSTGLVDAKGNTNFNFQPVEKWKHRLLLLEKRYL